MELITQTIKRLTESQFENLIDKMPTTNIELDWDGDNGSYRNDDHEFEFNAFLLRFCLSINEEGKTTPSTHESPSEYNVINKDIDVEFISEVWYGEDQVELTITQELILKETIIASII